MFSRSHKYLSLKNLFCVMPTMAFEKPFFYNFAISENVSFLSTSHGKNLSNFRHASADPLVLRSTP